MKPDFRVLRIDRTSFWNKEVRDLAGKLEAVYLLDVNRLIYCCELTPSYTLHYVGPAWENADETSHLFDLVMKGDVDTPEVDYVWARSLDVSKLEKREITKDEWEWFLKEYDGDEETAYDKAVEHEVSHLTCNGWIY